MQVDKTLAEFNAAREKVDIGREEQRLKKIAKLQKTLGEEMDPSAATEPLKLDLQATITQIIWTPLKHATFFRMIEQAGGIALASVFKLFATSMKKDFTSWLIPFWWI